MAARFVFVAPVTRIFNHQPVVAGHKDPDGSAVLYTEDKGWFVTLKGSFEAIYVGDVAPDGWEAGDRIRVTLEKVG